MGIEVYASLENITALTDGIRRIGMTVNTTRHKNQMTKGAFAQMSEAFNAYMDLIALAAPQRYHHIYEWDLVGVPRARLWKNVMGGSGGDRTISFDFMASKKTVPVLPPDQIGGVKFKRVHVFVWKAPIMEYNMPVTLRPKLAKVIAYPERNSAGVPTGKVIYRRSPPYTVPYDIANPGGAETTGAMTAAFAQWWGGDLGEDALREYFTDIIEHETVRAFNRAAEGLGPARIPTKTVSFTTDALAASKAKKLAKLVTGDLENKYIEMARRRSDLLGD